MKKTGFVYKIVIDGFIRYIGVTNNIKRRQKEHIRAFNKGDMKYLYKMMRESLLDEKYIVLETISDELSIIDARRLEAKIILDDYFTNKNLWQSAPFSFKYF
jgi:hypothetical protein